MSFDQNLKYYCRAGRLYESCAAIQQKHRLCWATNEEAAKPATANRAPPAIAEGNLVFQTVNWTDQTSRWFQSCDLMLLDPMNMLSKRLIF